jgi:hypothetical protein
MYVYSFTNTPHEVFSTQHSTKGYFLVQYKMSESHFVSKTLPVGRKKGYLFLIVIEKQIFEN